MARRDKWLIKGLVRSASEYLVAGKAAQPTREGALFLTSCLPGSAPRGEQLGRDGVL